MDVWESRQSLHCLTDGGRYLASTRGKICWKIWWFKTFISEVIIQLHKHFTSASDYIWVCYDGQQQNLCYNKSK